MIDPVPTHFHSDRGTVVRLDLDGDAVFDAERLTFLLDVLDDTCASSIDNKRYAMHETARGRHIELRFRGTYPPLAIVAIQAILNSDWRREAFNLLRALTLGSAPEFWRQEGRWNTLYSEKLGRCEPMIDPTKFGSGRPALGPDDFGDADVAILTVKEAEEIEITQDNMQRPRLVLTFEEFPDKGYWCNTTAVKTLCGKLGNNEAKWTGKLVPLIRAMTRNPSTGKNQAVMWVADGDKWEDLIAENSGRRRPASRGKATAKKRR